MKFIQNLTDKPVCPSRFTFEIIGGRVYNIKFVGGCNGNLTAVSELVDGMTPKEIHRKLHGIKCGSRPISCASELATAVLKASAYLQSGRKRERTDLIP
jgi:uncharacterized protein (TIGR03905 family)